VVSIVDVNENDLIYLTYLYKELSNYKSDLNKMKNNFKWMKNNSDYIILGAKENDLLVGSVMGVICRDLIGGCRPFMVIENMIVASKYRGKGIGTMLMKHIEKIAIDKNCYYITLVSNINRKEAHRFYQTLDYKIDNVQGFKKYLYK